MMSLVDIFYMSGRKSSRARGGLIATNPKEHFDQLMNWLPVYEGFSTYGGMSTKEIEAMAVGLEEMTETEVAGSSPEFIRYLADASRSTASRSSRPRGLACHLDARAFLPHVPPLQYPAGPSTRRCTSAPGRAGSSAGRCPRTATGGREVTGSMELVRIAMPRRAFTLGHIEYVADRMAWLHQHRELIGGLKFVDEPPVMRFFFGRSTRGWRLGLKIVEAFEADFGGEL